MKEPFVDKALSILDKYMDMVTDGVLSLNSVKKAIDLDLDLGEELFPKLTAIEE